MLVYTVYARWRWDDSEQAGAYTLCRPWKRMRQYELACVHYVQDSARTPGAHGPAGRR